MTRLKYSRSMDKLSDLLGSYDIGEPSEIEAIKDYVMNNFNVAVAVAVKGDALIVTVKSAALANSLRFRMLQIQSAANTDKKLIFRIT
jgi:hypothetical protein